MIIILSLDTDSLVLQKDLGHFSVGVFQRIVLKHSM